MYQVFCVRGYICQDVLSVCVCHWDWLSSSLGDDVQSCIPNWWPDDVHYIISLMLQTDILRTNKVLRDVSRALGADWRPVFESLMAHFPADVRDGALKKIEGERPILQAYKAFMMWKEACGPDFDVRRILDALRNNGLDDLEQMTISILDSLSLLFVCGFVNISQRYDNIFTQLSNNHLYHAILMNTLYCKVHSLTL